jgi:MFS transporter, AAHS family, 4-hydroxybenzoate transporter
LGWALGVGRVGSIVGPAVGGLMLATAPDARHVYVFCTVPALVGAISIALLRWRAGQTAAEQASVPTRVAEMERNS